VSSKKKLAASPAALARISPVMIES